MKSIEFYLIFFLFLFLRISNTKQDDSFDFQNELLHRKCEMEKNCQLPACNCDSSDMPVDVFHNYKVFEMPQLVVLTIDDENLDLKSYQIYKKLLENFRNPDKSPIRATFFISDTENKTSFCLVRNLYDKKHEIAISTVNYTCPNKRCSPDKNFQAWDYLTWSEQILQMRQRLHRYAGIAKSEIVGFRAPILEPASDMHFKIISSNKFVYDSSLVMNADDLLWPFTLDFTINSPLSNNGPINLYPGLWELPIPTYLDLNNKKEKCLKLWEGHCQFDRTTKGVAKFLRHHFLRAYYKNRAPVVLHFNSNWLREAVKTSMTEVLPGVPNNKESSKVKVEKNEYRNLHGVIKFINDTLRFNKDVYFVTAQQAIEWMKLMPRLKEERVDLAKLIKNEIFHGNWSESDFNFDGECPDLKQSKPDYDKDELLELDDNFGDELRKKLKFDRSSTSILAKLQSEILFLNNTILFFIIAIVGLLVVIIIYDKYF